MGRTVVVVGLAVVLLAAAAISPRSVERTAGAAWSVVNGAAHEEPVTIRFVGDMSFDRYIRRVSDRNGDDFVFSCLGDVLRTPDLTVGNLEGPITANDSKSLGTAEGTANNYVFTFPTSTGERLKREGVDIVNIGNNHIGDFGRDGLVSTQQALSGAGVHYFGGLRGDEPIYRTSVRGIDLSFVSYNQFGGQSPEQVAAIIRAEKDAGRRVMVYAHWGEEYVQPTERMRAAAKLFADAGADLVIGSHPHVVQERERIGNTLVFYSLGNFLFDQYWDPSVTTGLTVLAHVTGSGITADEAYVTLEKDGRTCAAQ